MQDTDQTSLVREVWFGNFTNSVVSVRILADSYVVSEEQLLKLEEWSKTQTKGGSAGVDIGIEGLGSIGLSGAGESMTGETGSTETEITRAYAITLIKAGFQDVLPGRVVKFAVQTPVQTHFVSCIVFGKLVRNNMQIVDPQVVVNEDRSVVTSSTVSLHLIPDQSNLFSPAYLAKVKRSLEAFQKLYNISRTPSGEALDDETVSQIVQASVEMKSANVTVALLLTAVVTDWLLTDVAQLYRDSASAEVFLVNMSKNLALLSSISATSIKISECFKVAAKWYTSVQVSIKDAQMLVYGDVSEDLVEMTDSLLKTARSVHGLPLTFEERVIEFNRKAKNLATDDGEQEDEVNELLGEIRKYGKDFNSEVGRLKAVAYEEVQKRHRQMQLSAIAFLGGPFVGATVMAVTGRFYEAAKSSYNKLAKEMDSAAVKAGKATVYSDTIATITSLSDDLDDLIGFSNLMSAWFLERGQSFQSWGQAKSDQVAKVEEEQRRFREISMWGKLQFVDWLKKNAENLHTEFGAQIFNSIDESWKATELLYSTEKELKALIGGWGLQGNYIQKMLNVIRVELFAGITVDVAWARYTPQEFMFELRKSDDLLDFEREFEMWLLPQSDWSGSEMVSWTRDTILEGLGMNPDSKRDRRDATFILFEIQDKIMRVQEGSEQFVNYEYWKGGYDTDVAFLNSNRVEMEKMRTSLNTLNTGFAIRGAGALLPSSDEYPKCGFKSHEFSVQKEAALFL